MLKRGAAAFLLDTGLAGNCLCGAPSLSEYTSDNILPGHGAGIRYMIDEKRRINMSVDFAGGKDSDAFYFRIGEAF
jgi:hypothetical protein